MKAISFLSSALECPISSSLICKSQQRVTPATYFGVQTQLLLWHASQVNCHFSLLSNSGSNNLTVFRKAIQAQRKQGGTDLE